MKGTLSSAKFQQLGLAVPCCLHTLPFLARYVLLDQLRRVVYMTVSGADPIMQLACRAIQWQPRQLISMSFRLIFPFNLYYYQTHCKIFPVFCFQNLLLKAVINRLLFDFKWFFITTQFQLHIKIAQMLLLLPP